MPELSYLALLACPVGMGLMMWMMMRGGSKQEPTASDAVNKQAELTQLQAQIDQLKAEHDNRRTQAARLREETDDDPVPALSPANHALGAEHSRR